MSLCITCFPWQYIRARANDATYCFNHKIVALTRQSQKNVQVKNCERLKQVACTKNFFPDQAHMTKTTVHTCFSIQIIQVKVTSTKLGFWEACGKRKDRENGQCYIIYTYSSCASFTEIFAFLQFLVKFTFGCIL